MRHPGHPGVAWVWTQGWRQRHMTTMELVPNLRLQKVGEFSRAGQDLEIKPLVHITSKLPTKAENFRCGPEGT